MNASMWRVLRRGLRWGIPVGSVLLVPVIAYAQWPRTTTPPLVFDGVTVVDVEHGRLAPAQRVVIAGTHIQAAGGKDSITMPKGARVVDARSKYLIPGLWDMHIHPMHFAPIFYPLLIANGVTGIRDAWSDVPLDTLLQWKQEILAGSRVGPPRQLLAGRVLQSPADADSRKAAGANFLKVYPFTFELAAAARRVSLPFGGHVGKPGGREPPEKNSAIEIMAIVASDSGIRIIDHVNTSGGLDTLCVGPRASIERCRPVADHLRRNGTWWTPTLVHLLQADLGGVRSEMGSLAMVERFQTFARRYWSGAAVPPDWLHDVASAADANATADSLRFLAIARQAGLLMLAGTDTETGYDQQNSRDQPPGFSLQVELAILAAEGLTPLEALQAATLNPARMLGATDSLGTVATGKLADLVLLDADPLVDITNLARIHGVMANGRYFDRAALDHLLATVQVRGKQDFRWFGEVP